MFFLTLDVVFRSAKWRADNPEYRAPTWAERVAKETPELEKQRKQRKRELDVARYIRNKARRKKEME